MSNRLLDSTPAGRSGEQPLALNVEQVAYLLDISVRSVWRLTSMGELPSPVAIGRSRRWLRQAIDEYLARKASTCTGPGSANSRCKTPSIGPSALAREVMDHE